MRFRREKKQVVQMQPPLPIPMDVQEHGSYTASICGHPTEIKGIVEAFGDSTITDMPLVGDAPEYCLACISSMAIQCAWCKGSIFIGDAVTTYSPSSAFVAPEHAVRYRDNAFVGCLRMNCAETGADRKGFWLPDREGRGHVQRMLSPIELVMMGQEVVVVDVTDSSQAISVPGQH